MHLKMTNMFFVIFVLCIILLLNNKLYFIIYSVKFKKNIKYRYIILININDKKSGSYSSFLNDGNIIFNL